MTFLPEVQQVFLLPNVNVVVADWINWDPSYVDTVLKTNLLLPPLATEGMFNSTGSVYPLSSFDLTIHSKIQEVKDSIAAIGSKRIIKKVVMN